MSPREMLEFLDTSSLYQRTDDSSVVPPGDLVCSKLPTVSDGSRNKHDCQSPDCKTGPVFCKTAFGGVQPPPRDETTSTGTDVSGGSGQMVGNKTGIGSAEDSSEH